MKFDLSTPEGALDSLEDAYNRKDVDAAVAAKDFMFEAKEMLVALKNLAAAPDEDLVNQTAKVLELAFRKQTERKGFPDFSKLRCRVVDRKALREDLVELVEECVFPDGGKSRQTLHAAKNQDGWHIVILPRDKTLQ